MKKALIIALALLIPNLSFAAISAEEKAEIKKYIAKKTQIDAGEVENEMKRNAVNKAYREEIEEIKKRIIRQKIDEARNYQPKKKEIVAELKRRMELLKNCAEDGIDYCNNPTECSDQGYYWYDGTCNAVPNSNIEQPVE